MSEGFANPITNNQGQIRVTSISSPNYVPNVIGWAIFKDGSSEFNGGTFRGSVIVGDGTNGPGLEISEAPLPTELMDFYSHNLSDAYIKMLPGDGEQSYYYQLVGYDKTNGYKFFSDGIVDGSVAPSPDSVHFLTQFAYFHDTAVTQVDWMNDFDDSRFLVHANYSFFEGFLEVGAGPGGSISTFGFQSDGPAYFEDDVRLQNNGGLILESGSTAFFSDFVTFDDVAYHNEDLHMQDTGNNATLFIDSGSNFQASAGSVVHFDADAAFDIGGVYQPRGHVWSTFLTASVTTGAVSGTEYVAVVTSAITFRAGHAYRFQAPYGKLHAATVMQPAINLWKIPTTGTYTPGGTFSPTGATQIGNGPREQLKVAGQDQAFQPSFTFVVAGGSNVTCRIVLTIVPNAAVAAVLGGGAAPGQVLYEIVDIGAATDYVGASSL